MPHKNDKYDDAFKLEAVRISEPTAQSIAEVAGLLGLQPQKLLLWHAQYGHRGDDQYPLNVISRLEQEIGSLRAANQQLRLECARLQKALSFSAAALQSETGSQGE